MNKCKTNNLIKKGISIIIQITFVFAFLTIFFFVYVQNVERNDFQEQLDLIVDNIMKDIDQDIVNIIEKNNINSNDIAIILDGIIDIIQEKISMRNKKSLNNILNQNQKIKKTALNSLMTFIAIIIIICLFILLLGFCMPIVYQIKEAMLVIIFIVITEFIILKLIARNYISADPNKIKRTLGKSIQSWIKNNKNK